MSHMILVLVPLQIEHSALVNELTGIPHASVNMAIGGHGKVQFALSTQSLIQKYQPKLVICAGSAGALVEQVKPEDVVVSEHTIEHDYSLKFVARPLPKFSGSAKAIQYLKTHAKFEDFRIHFAAVASGDEDVMEATRAQEIHRRTSAVAVAWEGAGGARAAQLHRVDFLEIRGITDSANHLAAQSFEQNVKRAMCNTARVIRLLLESQLY